MRKLLITLLFSCFLVGSIHTSSAWVQPDADVYSKNEGDHLSNNDDVESFIIEKAREQLENHFASGEYRFEVRPRWIPDQLLKQNPDQILGVRLQGEVKRYTNFKVLYNLQGDRRNKEIQLQVEADQKIPVVTDRVRRGEELTKEKLTIDWVSLSHHSGKYITDVAMLEGKKLKRTLLSGQPVRQSFVRRELVVEAGDQVKVVIERKGIQVQITGEARENGSEGDRIKIYSNETRKKYVGEVIRPGVIEWKNTL